MAYNAIVGKIKLCEHPNADRLLLGTICGEQVIVGKDTDESGLFVFFPTDGQLSQAFAAANDLVSYTDPATGEKRGGYFGKNRRVQTQRLRGEVSDGFVCSFEHLAKAGVAQTTIDALAEGDTFTELDNIEICRKYVTPATQRAQGKSGTAKAKKKNPRFPEHYDTKQFRHEAQNIPDGAIVWITEKLHGTSARYSFVQEETTLKRQWWEVLLFRKTRTILQYAHLSGTRRVILSDVRKDVNGGFYGNHAFRLDFMDNVRALLHKGEIVYGEIVGFSSMGKSIMPSVSTESLRDKKFKKQYGSTMTYKYGCPEGGHRFYVYRIVMVNEDGHLTDLPWQNVQHRAQELGLETVPTFEGPILFKKNNLENFTKLVQESAIGPSVLDSSHIREGVCVRVEAPARTYNIKEKSTEFKILEGIIKDDANYIDTEEAEDII